jgi:hypothetical protein
VPDAGADLRPVEGAREPLGEAAEGADPTRVAKLAELHEALAQAVVRDFGLGDAP